MILNREDAIHAANIFVSYYKDFGRIDDYLRKVKLEDYRINFDEKIKIPCAIKRQIIIIVVIIKHSSNSVS